MASTCYVSLRDYLTHWQEDALAPYQTPQATLEPYAGPERRSGVERRSSGHERRWDASAGRRRRLADRRRS